MCVSLCVCVCACTYTSEAKEPLAPVFVCVCLPMPGAPVDDMIFVLNLFFLNCLFGVGMKALEMAGGVHGLAHRRLIDVLNTANITKLCSLKGIGKQVWVREIRESERDGAE